MYKKIKIPVGQILYRRYENHKIQDNMFFGFDNYYSIKTTCNDYLTQKWEVIKEINSTLIVKEARFMNTNLFETDICSIYKKFDNSIQNNDYLFLKSYNNPKRNDFIIFLKEIGINSWVTNVENGSPSMELFLFESQNNQFVKYIEDDTTKKKINNFPSLEKANQISN